MSLPLAPLLARRRPGMVNAWGPSCGVWPPPPSRHRRGLGRRAAVLVGGALWGPYTAVEATALHRWTDPGRHGRVFGVQRSLLATTAPLGAAVGALGLERFPPQAVLGASAIACAVAGLLALAHPGLRQPD